MAADSAIFKLRVAGGYSASRLHAPLKLKASVDAIVKARKRKIANVFAQFGTRKLTESQERKKGLISSVMDNMRLKDIVKTHYVPFFSIYQPFIPIANVYNVLHPKGVPRFGKVVEFDFRAADMGDYMLDFSIHFKFGATYNTEPGDFVRWAEFPGERIIDHIEHRIANVRTDEATAYDLHNHYQYRIPASRKPIYEEMIGNGSYEEAIYIPYGVPTSPNPATNTVNLPVRFGPQVPEHAKEEFSTITPIPLWFTENLDEALPGIVFAPDTTKVIMTLAPMSKMLETLGVTNDGHGTGSVVIPSIQCMLFANTLYLPAWFLPAIVDFSVDRVVSLRKSASYTMDTNSMDIALTQDFHHPVVNIIVNVRPAINDTFNASWFKNGVLEDKSFQVVVSTNPIIPPGVPSPGASLALCFRERPTVSSIYMKDVNIKLQPPEAPPTFHSQYAPFTTKTHSTDSNSYFFPMTLHGYPKKPMGYLDFSKTDNLLLHIEKSAFAIAAGGDYIVQVFTYHMQNLIIAGGTGIMNWAT